jgi:hypothetical protein
VKRNTLAVLWGCAAWLSSAAALAAAPAFHGEAGPLPEDVAATMKQYSWREGCPVPLDELSLIRLNFWGYDGALHEGELVVNRAVSKEVIDVFRELFEKKFPIERMRLIDAYKGSDDASMDENNTSGFNCRWMTGKKGVFSNHSYGRAIDINPLTNPYVAKKTVSPKAGKAYLDRTKPAPGLITAEGECFTAFNKYGWTWGGAWKGTKDYQHFEKK